MPELLDNEFSQTPKEKMSIALNQDANEVRKWLFYTTLSNAIFISTLTILISSFIKNYLWQCLLLIYLSSILAFPFCFYLTARFIKLSIFTHNIYLKFLPPASFVYKKIGFALSGLMQISLIVVIATAFGSVLFYETKLCGPYLSILLTAILYGFLYSMALSSSYFNRMHEEYIKLSQKEDFDYDFD